MPSLPDIGASLPEVVLRTAIVYLFLVVALRLGGKRQVGQMSVLELVARRSKPLRTAIEGEPRLLVRDGKLLTHAIAEEGLEEEEVRAAIRSHGIAQVEDVRFAVLETGGSISVIPRDEDKPASNRPPGDEHKT